MPASAAHLILTPAAKNYCNLKTILHSQLFIDFAESKKFKEEKKIFLFFTLKYNYLLNCLIAKAEVEQKMFTVVLRNTILLPVSG